MLRAFKFWLNNWREQRLHLSFRQWIFIVIPLLCLAIIPLTIFLTQFKNFAIKPQHYSVDSIFPMSYLLEREHSRFATALHNEYEHIHLQSSDSIQELKKRYEILVSRVLLVKNTPIFDQLKGNPEFETVIANMDEFIKVMDPILQRMDASYANPDDFKLIFGMIEKNSNSLLELTNIAQRIVYRKNDERAAQIEDQGKLIFGLMATQWFLLVGAVLALMLYIAKQRDQHLALLNVTSQLQTANKQAQEANKAKSIFLANMSHELRTPFQGMMGMLHLLSETPLTHVQQDYSSTALTSARHLLGILNDILDSSAIESGAMALNLAPLNLPELILEIEALMSPAANQKNIELRVVGANTLPVWIEGDAKRLSQVLFNLINNAIKFTANGEVLLEFSVRSMHSEGQLTALTCKVQDTGIGMDAETIKNLFVRFQQADNTIHRRYGGSGLGLEISLNLAILMGGGITVESAKGLGSTFTFEIPCKTVNAPRLTTVSDIQPVQDLRILIADDHPTNVKYLEILLKNMGHTTFVCENGVCVLELLKQFQVDVILMDLHMPVLDGLDTTKAIRKLEGSIADVKIIMVSADILPEARRLAFEAGITEFMAKPVQAITLQRSLDRIFNGSLNNSEISTVDNETFGKNTQLEVINTKLFYEFRELMPDEIFNQQLKTFFGEENEAVQIISKTIDSNIRIDIAEHAHSMKGVCLLIGLTLMANTLSKIEKGAGELSIVLLNNLLAQFQSDIDRTRQILNTELQLH